MLGVQRLQLALPPCQPPQQRPQPPALSLTLTHALGQVGRENPAELKAQKLARSVTRGVVDRNLKPDTEERAHIGAVLDYPPNRWAAAGAGRSTLLLFISGPLGCSALESGMLTDHRWASGCLVAGR